MVVVCGGGASACLVLIAKDCLRRRVVGVDVVLHVVLVGVVFEEAIEEGCVLALRSRPSRADVKPVLIVSSRSLISEGVVRLWVRLLVPALARQRRSPMLAKWCSLLPAYLFLDADDARRCENEDVPVHLEELLD